MNSGARKKVALFVNRPMALQSMHDIEIPAQRQHAHNGAPCRPIIKVPLFSKHPAKKTDVLIMKITMTCNELDHSNCV